MHRGEHSSLIAASPALFALRRGATLSACVVALAILTQTLVFAFVHFTEIRFESEAAQAKAPEQLTVVEAKPRKRIDPAVLEKQTEAVDRKPGRGDAVLNAVSSTASGVGVVGLAVFVAQCWMATSIVAGAGVIGMQRAVRAATIATALFAMGLPWTSAIPSAPIWGVFCGYRPLIDASAAVAAGSRSDLVVMTLHGFLPLVMLALTIWAAFSLRVGISAGIIRHAIDPVVEAEIAAVQTHGAGSLYAVRSSGDLNRAIAASNLAAPVRIAGDNEADRVMADLEKLAGRRHQPEAQQPSGLRPTGTDPLRRPI